MDPSERLQYETALLNYTPFYITKFECGYTFVRLYDLEFITLDGIYADLNTWACKSATCCVHDSVKLYLDANRNVELPRGPLTFKRVVMSQGLLRPLFPIPERVAYRLFLDDGHTH